MNYRPEWLNLVKEQAIEPDLPIVDTHHHLWDDERAVNFGMFLADDLLREISESGHNVVATVYVEARSHFLDSGPEQLRASGETRFADAAATDALSRSPTTPRICAGIVGYADLALGAAVDELLEAHVAASPSRFRGIRYQASWDREIPPLRNRTEHMLQNPAVIEGLRCMAARDLVLDTHVFHPQLSEVVELARAVPEATIVLNHLGTPIGIQRYAGRREEALHEWRAGMAKLAECPNIRIKLGGTLLGWVGMDIAHGERPPESEALAAVTRDYYLPTIELFSPQRCMFESDFPVDRDSVSYGVLWNSYKRLTQGFSADERDAMFRRTAVETYRLSI